jgi:hypothetical protein
LREGEKEILFPFAIIIDWQKKPQARMGVKLVFF